MICYARRQILKENSAGGEEIAGNVDFRGQKASPTVAACGALWRPVAACGGLWGRIGCPIETFARRTAAWRPGILDDSMHRVWRSGVEWFDASNLGVWG
jgi:hypothetical protein